MSQFLNHQKQTSCFLVTTKLDLFNTKFFGFLLCVVVHEIGFVASVV